MQQHPVPQNITGFQFKLIGSLTIKQFAYLVASSIISFVIYLTFSGFLEIILIAPVLLAGLALAFAKIDGMEFDDWAAAFFNAVTKPTQRVWRKQTKNFSFLDPQFSYYLKRPQAAAPGVSDRSKLESFLAEIDTRQDIADQMNSVEDTKLSRLDFGGRQETPTDASQRSQPTPGAGVNVEVKPVQQVIEEQRSDG